MTIGGGSTIGLALAIAMESGLPIAAVPTTYAGSEMTPIYGLTEVGVKTTGRDPRVLLRSVVYDPEQTLGLPLAVTVTSAFNAIVQATEGPYAPDGNSILSLMAEEGIRAFAAALGMPADGLDRAADLAAQTPYPNPRPLDGAALRALLQRAFDGAARQP